MKHPPKLVCALAYGHDAWVVGSGAKEDNADPRDWDVLVPFSEWFAAAMLIPKDAVPNAFGGWKCMSDGKEIDVWPGDLGYLLSLSPMSVAWHPKSGTRVVAYGGKK
jgi:hypothetical protein